MQETYQQEMQRWYDHYHNKCFLTEEQADYSFIRRCRPYGNHSNNEDAKAYKEFCATHGISNGTYNKLSPARNGLARAVHIGK